MPHNITVLCCLFYHMHVCTVLSNSKEAISFYSWRQANGNTISQRTLFVFNSVFRPRTVFLLRLEHFSPCGGEKTLPAGFLLSYNYVAQLLLGGEEIKKETLKVYSFDWCCKLRLYQMDCGNLPGCTSQICTQLRLTWDVAIWSVSCCRWPWRKLFSHASSSASSKYFSEGLCPQLYFLRLY